MPRVATKTKSKGGKTGTYQCDGCGVPIVPGELSSKETPKHL